jgi:hypothetical protein
MENAPPSRPRDPEQNASRRSESKPGPMSPTSTSPIPQRSTKTNVDQQPPRASDQSSSGNKQEERKTGGNTGIQEQSPWDRSSKRSS